MKLRVLYICTTFPKRSEQFIMREVDALSEQPVELEIVTLWGGNSFYKGLPVRRFSKLKLFRLFWVLPLAFFLKPRVMSRNLKWFLSRRPPSLLNLLENLLGYGFALTQWFEVEKNKPDLIHGTWATSPASAAHLLSVLTGIPFSMGAHAYDVFEDGGDWHLAEKLRRTSLLHTTSQNTCRALLQRGSDPRKTRVILSGLMGFPPLKPLRSPRNPLRVLYVGRLVEKKGLFYQIDLLQSLKASGVPFRARMVGSGDLDGELKGYRDRSGLQSELEFWGEQTFAAVQEQFDWADLFLYTGKVSGRGDRDGLPNVIGEAMAHGVVVLTTAVGATTEAVEHGVTGLVLPPDDPRPWVDQMVRFQRDDAQMKTLRENARAWVEEHFDARRNSRELYLAFLEAVGKNERPNPEACHSIST